MATKLRSISTNTATKVMAFILLVISMTAVMVQLQFFAYQRLNPESLFVEEYIESNEYLRYAQGSLIRTYDIIAAEGEVRGDIDFLYHITDGETVFSNTEDGEQTLISQHDTFYVYENGRWSADGNARSLAGSHPGPLTQYGIDDNYTIYVAFPNEVLEAKELEWQAIGSQLRPIFLGIILSVVLSILLMIYLISVTGRKPQDKELHLSEMDNIYSDILFTCFIILSVALIWIFYSSTESFYGNISGLDQFFYMFLWGTLTAVLSVLYVLVILSLARKIKAGKLLRHSMIYIISSSLYNFCQSLFDGRMFAGQPLTRSLFYRQLIFIAASAVLVFFTFVFFLAGSILFLVFPILEGVIIYWYIQGNNKTFADINKGFDASLQEKMRAERMKVALVTNVSHDLKTPLTSIISYADLLSHEENLPDTARDYVRILSQKANRLKQIVSDLFDLSKSTTGNIALELEPLDIKKLIEQTLGDMEDKIEKAEVQVKTKLPDNPVNVIADGKKLYRVFQNVIDNALKYSHKDTRIYVELTHDNDEAIATIKNTAGYEMDFTAEEILQRFNRGDKSRTTEGSGLGLSIAESFTNVCGGAFKVEIDGDLFKVTISFKVP
ncbi:sensor histidine kinase [Dethiobacter alkaliphilus]|uniref:sensor histidine kinase n=1 Tax=Dethiobacter alkaliphilus TaxID=427926 RepID=UPI002227A673|nr:HAMP domain-containing histidine kinase [Dethiobacter alkaliphilus]MCW3489753.1 HAMP domain-containing histidine kinase [Dethiobacter alkaliphilus]